MIAKHLPVATSHMNLLLAIASDLNSLAGAALGLVL
jgi:hypothetical protein